MRRYGSDKPDLRFDMELVDIAELVKGCEFKVFTDWASADDGRVVALRAPGAASLSRKQIDELAEHAAKYGDKGLAGIKVADAGKGRGGLNQTHAEFLVDATLVCMMTTTDAPRGALQLLGGAR